MDRPAIVVLSGVTPKEYVFVVNNHNAIEDQQLAVNMMVGNLIPLRVIYGHGYDGELLNAHSVSEITQKTVRSNNFAVGEKKIIKNPSLKFRYTYSRNKYCRR